MMENRFARVVALCLFSSALTLSAQTAGRGQARLLPDSFLREYDPVTLIFTEDRGPASGGPADDGSKLLKIQPEQSGEYRWLDSRSLQFLPSEPWPALKRFTFTAPGLEKKLSTLMPPPSSLSPSPGSSNLSALDSFSLSFSQPLDLESLSQMLSIEIRPLPGLGSQGPLILTHRDFAIKEIERGDRKASAQYRVSLAEPIPDGRSINLRLKLSLDASIPGSLASYSFSTRGDFRLTSFGSGSAAYPVSSTGSSYPLDQAINCGTGKSPLFLEFSESLDRASPIEALKRMISFEPAVRNLKFEFSGNRLFLSFDRDSDMSYRLSLKHEALVSGSGRRLSDFGPSGFYFYYKSLSPYLSWKAGQGILERYGAQVFPMRGRGLGKLDLRIYRIEADNRNFWPFPSGEVVVNEATRPPMPGEEPAYGSALKEQIRLLGSPEFSSVIDLPIQEGGAEANFGLDLSPYLRKIQGVGKPGSYLVGYRRLGNDTERRYVRVQVTDLCLTTIEEEQALVFAVTSLSSGKPLAGAEITLEGIVKGQALELIQGRSDKDGRFRYQHGKALPARVSRIAISYEGDQLSLDPDQAPPYFSSNHWFGSDSRWLSWLERDARAEADKPRLKAYLYSERPIYRAEEAVHIQGFLRIREKGLIKSDAPGRKRSLSVTAPTGKDYRYPVSLSGNGYFYKLFNETGLPSGEYRVRLYDDETGAVLSSFSFRKEAYRVPSFEVTLSGPDKVAFDKPFDIILSAAYYSGGMVAGQRVDWDLSEMLYAIRPASFANYIFSSYVQSGGAFREQGLSSVERRGVTDDSGTATLKIDPRSAQSIQARAYHIQAYVRGADAQTVAASKTVLALPPFAIGLKLSRFETEKQAVRPSIIVLDHQEKPLAGKAITVKLYERQWHSYLSESDISTGASKYVSDVVDSLVSETSYVSRLEALEIELAVKNAGVYIVEVQGRDELGRLQSVKQDLYVSGPDPVAWKKTEAAVFETSLSKSLYEPGQDAQILIQSPFQEAMALVIIEAPMGNEYRWVEVKGGKALFSVAVREEHVPRLPVHIVLMRGRIAQANIAQAKASFQNGVDRMRPLTVANTTWINVDPSTNRLNVSLEHEIKAQPGADFKVKILVSDRDGKPVDGEVCLWLVDRAVLSLAPERFSNPLDAFIDQVQSALRISDSRNMAVGNLPFEESPGGDRASGAMSKMALLDRTTVRKNFQTVPYYNPAIKVVRGQAEISFKLPDNLTDFALRAIATSGFDKFGIARSQLSMRLPVMAQEALPRFVRPGDVIQAGAIARVTEGPGGKAKAQVKVEGLRLFPSGKQEESFAVELSQTKATDLYFRMLAPPGLASAAESEVSFTVGVERDSDQARDAFSLSLPVRNDSVTRSVEASIVPASGKEYAFPAPTEKARAGGTLQTIYICAQPDLMRVLSALRFQQSYEYGCTEQRISRAYPVIALGAALGASGLPSDFVVNETYLKGLLAYLETVISPEGLYAFYPGNDGSVYLSAFVVEFLAAVNKAGYEVSPTLLSKPTQALKAALRSDYDHFSSGHSLMERSLALCALDAVGSFETAYAQELLSLAQDADPYTRARIYSCLVDKKGVNATALKKLGQGLSDSLVFKRQGSKLEFVGMQRKADWTGNPFLYGSLRESAAVYAALSRIKPESAELRAVLAFILDQADPEGWGDSYTNTCVLLSLADYIANAKTKKGGALEYHDGKSWQVLDSQGRPFARLSLKLDTPLKLRMKTMDAKNPPTLFMITEYIPELLGSQISAFNAGFFVERELIDYGSGKAILTRNPVKKGAKISFKRESVIEDHVRLINPEPRSFVALRVPLASGFEPMNPQLSGSVKEAVPAGRNSLAPAYVDYEDHQVTFYYNDLPAGTFDFYFRVRANFEGAFILPPAKAQALYNLRVQGYSDGAAVNVEGSSK